MSRPLSARATARALGIGHAALLRFYRDGAFDAEIHEGATIRFDLQKVRIALAKRAKAHRSTTRHPAGMVPTF
jgi:hypothetical protein